jgi:hypothetical protein
VSFTQLWCAGSDTTRAAIAGHHSEISTPRKAAEFNEILRLFYR